MSFILHITDVTTWTHAQARGAYEGDTLHTEGFIHCSTPQQVVRVADARFRGRMTLLLLCIDSRRVGARITYENLEGGSELFPHIYGPLPLDAVVSALPFPPGDDGKFTLPALPTLT